MPRRILFLDHAQAIGGAENCLLLLISHLNRAHWMPILGCQEGKLAEEAKKIGTDLQVFSFPGLRNPAGFLPSLFKTSRHIANFARKNQIICIQANTVRTAFYGVLAARWAGIPFIWHMHDFWLSESEPKAVIFDHFLKRLIGAWTSGIIVNSNALKNHLPFRRKISVIHNGIDLEVFGPSPSFQDQDLHPASTPEGPVIGTIGRLRPLKGQDRFLRIASRIAKKKTGLRFVIVGGANFDVPDHYAEDLKKLADHLGVHESVIFTGHMQDIRPVLSSFDIFVNPGDPETFGLVNLEAMALSKPIVAFDQAALPEIVADQETGILVPPGDEQAMADAVEFLLAHPDLAARMGRAGRKRVEQYFTAERMAAEIQAVWEKVLT